jgi:hypothetical protein
MIIEIRYLVIISVFATFLAGSASAKGWGDYIVTADQHGVAVSYRQRALEDGWMVEWKGENNSADWVEPEMQDRIYTCTDGKKFNAGSKSLGPLPAGEQRNGAIRDKGICVSSQIESVEIVLELQPVSEKTRQMWQ